ncbi:hypothetical protein [Streptomyces bauhiniae]|uniref:hypothetical protein n=1 Tax=Streptomyces bauhiniae TaxID=2340725 RepID=UPI0036688545
MPTRICTRSVGLISGSAEPSCCSSRAPLVVARAAELERAERERAATEAIR